MYFVKQLIGAEYGRNNLDAQYANFGIVKEGGGYVIPRERDSRIQSLRMMVSGMTTAPFSGNVHGLAYWQDILTRYITAKEDLELESMKLTGDVTDKSKLRNDVLRLLRSLKYLVMAFFPDTHDRVLRDFGYLDEYV